MLVGGEDMPVGGEIDLVADTLVTDTEPIPGYDTLSLPQIALMLPELSQDGLFRVQRHERTNRNRPTVLDKVTALQERQPWPHFDVMSTRQIVDRLAHADRSVAADVFGYERRHRRRADVVAAAHARA